MDMSKKASFVHAYGKKRARFAKGGAVRGRKHFDSGGTVLGGPTTNNPSANTNQGAIGGVTSPLTTAVNNGPLSLLPGVSQGVNGLINGVTSGLTNNFQATAAPIQYGTNVGQLNNAYTGALGALGNQGKIVGELQPQIPQAVAEQNAVAQSAENMLNGTGPNPAQTQLATATGNNVATTTAEMAGQRGASANPALIAREAAQQGAATQQNAAGQAATLGAQQQIAAQGTLANLANNQVSQTGQAITNQNNAEQGEQAALQNANSAANNAAVAMQSNVNSTNAQVAAGNQNAAGNLFGGVTSGLSSALGFLNKGGAVGADEHLLLAEMNAHSLNHSKKLAGGGEVNEGQIQPSGVSSAGPNISNAQSENGSSSKDSTLKGGISDTIGAIANLSDGGSVDESRICRGPHNSHVANFLARGGPVESMVSEGEVYLNPEQVRRVIHEDADPAKVGTKIKARNSSQKATVRGDSLKNDKIPMTLEDGGVVVDRKNMSSADKRKLFVHRALARKKAAA